MPVITYILDNRGNPVAESDFDRWCEWYGTHDRTVKYDELSEDIAVSTVFLGVDINLSGRAPPQLWETVILGGPHDQYQRRYASRAAALESHDAALKLARGKTLH